MISTQRKLRIKLGHVYESGESIPLDVRLDRFPPIRKSTHTI